jgi:hypothetical protein
MGHRVVWLISTDVSRNILQDSNLRSHCHEKLRSHLENIFTDTSTTYSKSIAKAWASVSLNHFRVSKIFTSCSNFVTRLSSVSLNNFRVCKIFTSCSNFATRLSSVSLNHFRVCKIFTSSSNFATRLSERIPDNKMRIDIRTTWRNYVLYI